MKQSLNRNRDLISKYAYLGLRAQALGQYKRTQLHKLEERFQNLSRSEPARHIFAFLVAFSVVVANILLISAPVKYLASRNFDGTNTLHIEIAGVVVPVIFLILEIGISLSYRDAKESNNEEAAKFWVRLGWLMVLITPVMLFGSVFAEERWWELHNLFNSIGMFILAVATDLIIVRSGDRIYDAKAFVVFNFTRLSLLKDIDYYNSQRGKAGLNMERAYTRYTQALAKNKNNQNPPIDPGPFSRDTAEFINQWFGQRVINIRPPEEPPTPPNPNNLKSETDTDAEAESERDYYRDLLNNQIRNNDREVRPED